MDTEKSIQLKVNILAEKVKHYLVTLLDKTLEEANNFELYHALSFALREEIMVNWAATRRGVMEAKQRMVYYLSMEYLPGRMLGNTCTNLQANPVVEGVLRRLGRDLSSVMNAEGDPGLGNGGLGRLASCFLDSLATMQYPAMGYGLRYQYGIFEQEIQDGVQIERPDRWLLYDNPWHLRRDPYAAHIQYGGELQERKSLHGESVFDVAHYEEIRALPYDLPIIGYCSHPDYSVLTLRLWTTKESPRNFELQQYNAGRLAQASENTTLTDVLYPNDGHETGKRIRLKQEFLLASASCQDIMTRYLYNHKTFQEFPDRVRIQTNDTHPVVAIAELMRLFTYEYDIPWYDAWSMTTAACGFTNHTVLKEALEEWDAHLFSTLLPRQYRIIERINHDFLSHVRTKYPDDEEKVQRLSILQHGKVRMANLAIWGSHKVNGVAALHTTILKETVFKDFYDLFPEKFVNVTNGVTQRRWLLHCNPQLANLITEAIGPEWITDFSQVDRLRALASDTAWHQKLAAIKLANKESLCATVEGTILDPTSLFDVHIKRIHEYKRQLLNALHVITVYHDLLHNSDSHINRTVIFGGKAASGYRMAKNVIRLVCLLARRINRDEQIRGRLKVVMIENYNVSKAQLLIPATDLSEQISTAGMEASGTGNMKLSMNGALTIGTDDGANVEMRESVGDTHWPFLFGASSSEIAQMNRDHTYRPFDLYESNPKIKCAIDSLIDGTWAETEDERCALGEIHAALLEGHFGNHPDPYYVLHDMPSYLDTQMRVEEAYGNHGWWHECVVHNIAGMAPFSTDRSIQEYAEKIWDLTPCPPNPDVMRRIREEYGAVAPTLLL